MMLDAVLPLVAFAAVIWVAVFLLPRAIKEHSAFAVTCAALCVVLALVAWFLLGARVVL